MATYTDNLGIKKITPGDEEGTWGSSANTNFDLFDAAWGYAAHNFASDADVTLTLSDYASSTSRALILKFTDTTPVLTASRSVTFAPGDMKKPWFVENATAQTLTFKQGSAGTSVSVTPGDKAAIYSDGGGGTNGNVVDLLENLTLSGNLALAGALDVEGGADVAGTLTTEGLNIRATSLALNSDASGAPSSNIRLKVNRGSSPDVEIRWNESSDTWESTHDGSTYRPISPEEASAAQIRSGSTSNRLTASNVVSALGAVSTTQSGGYAPNWEAFINLHITASGNVTINNASNIMVNTWRSIWIVGNNTTARTITFGSYYKNAPVIVDLSNTRGYLVSLYAASSTQIIISAVGVSL